MTTDSWKVATEKTSTRTYFLDVADSNATRREAASAPLGAMEIEGIEKKHPLKA